MNLRGIRINVFLLFSWPFLLHIVKCVDAPVIYSAHSCQVMDLSSSQDLMFFLRRVAVGPSPSLMIVVTKTGILSQIKGFCKPFWFWTCIFWTLYPGRALFFFFFFFSEPSGKSSLASIFQYFLHMIGPTIINANVKNQMNSKRAQSVAKTHSLKPFQWRKACSVVLSHN